MFCFKCNSIEYKNEWNCEYVFTGRGKFMPEMQLKQPGFTYSACGPFTKNEEGIEKFMQNGNIDTVNALRKIISKEMKPNKI